MTEYKNPMGYCDICDDTVIFCETCGNFCCNGRSGKVNGKECSDCPEAHKEYEQQQDELWRKK